MKLNTPTITKVRTGSKMIISTIEERPAIFDFAEILKAVEVEADQEANPFEDQDTYKHELNETPENSNEKEMRGLVFINREGYRIVTPTNTSTRQEIAEQAPGAARQVINELMAAERRRYTDEATDARRDYENGYCDAWNVRATFEGYTSAVHNVYGHAYAIGESSQEVAQDIADDMTRDGYTINNRPNRNSQYAEAMKANKAEGIKRALNAQVWNHKTERADKFRAIDRNKRKTQRRAERAARKAQRTPRAVAV